MNKDFVRPLYYDMNGKLMKDIMEWGKLFENIKKRRIGLTILKNGYKISTVWLGIDHNWSPKGKPLIFESFFPLK